MGLLALLAGWSYFNFIKNSFPISITISLIMNTVKLINRKTIIDFFKIVFKIYVNYFLKILYFGLKF